MSRKHKMEVLIARVVFVIFLLAVGVLIWKLAAWGIRKFVPVRENTETESQQTETESQPYFVIDPNAPVIVDTETATETETETETESQPEEYKAKTTAGIRMRKEPNTNCDILTVIAEGTEVTVLSNEGEWSKITYGGYTGYVKTEYLKTAE